MQSLNTIISIFTIVYTSSIVAPLSTKTGRGYSSKCRTKLMQLAKFLYCLTL